MKKKTKVTKKKLKEPDEFINFTERTIKFIERNLRKIITVGTIIVFIVIAFFLYQRWEKGKEDESYQKFSSVLGIYQVISSSNQEVPRSEFKNLIDKFNEVVNRFPNTTSGKISLLYKGNLYLRMGEFDEAEKNYQAFLKKMKKEKLYKFFALEGLGHCYEGKKDYERALNIYKEALEIGRDLAGGNTYINIGRCYEKLGKKKEALESYRNFLNISQKSSLKDFVIKKISQLEK